MPNLVKISAFHLDPASIKSKECALARPLTLKDVFSKKMNPIFLSPLCLLSTSAKSFPSE
jgi:hypothetical protein